MKLKLLFIAVLYMAITISCDDIGSNLDPIPGYEYETVSPQAIAEAVAYIHPDKEICEEVHSAVRSAVTLGLDESYYFAEAFGGNERITKASKVKRSIQSKIKSLPVGNSIKEILTLVTDDSQYMDHYQIYWPYSDRWDGNTMPTITFQSKAAVPQEEGIGYRILNDRVEEVTVNEEYAKEHPVWIINYNPIPYGEYPDFAVRNWTHEDRRTFKYDDEYEPTLSERSIYYIKAYVQGCKKDPKLPNYIYNLKKIDFENDTLSLYIKNIRLKINKTYTSLFSGGCHYIFNIAVDDTDEVKKEDLANITKEECQEALLGEIVSVRFVLIRQDIKSNSVIVSLHTLLTGQWLEGENYSVYEVDQEVSREYPVVNYLNASRSLPNNSWFYYITYLGYYLTPNLAKTTICRRTLEESPDYIDYGNLEMNPFPICEFGVTKGATTPPWHTPTDK